MKKGVFFSTDAMLAFAIVIAIIAGMTAVGLGGQSDGATNALLYGKAADTSLVAFLKKTYAGNTGIDTFAPTLKANCEDVYYYTGNNTIDIKVKKCAILK